MKSRHDVATRAARIPPYPDRRGDPSMSENTPPILSNDEQASEQVAPNPFDPERLRIDLSFAEGIGVKKALVTVPVRKPNGQDFIRVHPDPSFRLPVATIELKDDRETYLVLPDIARDIPGEYVMSTMYTCINRAGVVFLWPVKLPNPDGRQLAWHHSAQVAAEMAMKRWIRV